MSEEVPTMILCGTDFTPCAAEAAEVAGAFAAKTNGPLVLTHALDELGGVEAALARLEGEARRLRGRFPGLQVEPRIETGIADEVLAGRALFMAAWAQGTQSVRLIVISSLGRRAPARWVLGSVAERTAQTATVPVLVVRDAKPFLSWLRGERPLRIAVGFDFSETATAALRWASELCDIAPCDVTVGHVTWPPEERKRVGASSALRTFKEFPQFETLLRNDLGVSVREHNWKGRSPSIRIKLDSGRRAKALAELAVEEQADLLVVGSRQTHGAGRLWQESVSRGALDHAPMSVACVPIAAPAGNGRTAPGESSGDGDETGLVRKLESHPFLRGLSGDVLRRLASISREEPFAPGAMLLQEGAEADTVFLLQSGLVAIEINAPGKGPTVLESLRGGDIVGLSWLFPPYRWHLDARAVEPAVAIAIDARTLREWMNEDAAIGQPMAWQLVHQLYERLDRVRLQRLDLYKAEP